MTKNERIKNLEKAVFELATLLGYKIDFSADYIIPKPMTWTTTFIEQLRVMRKELGIRIRLAQPQARAERIEVIKEKKNAKR